MSARKKAIFTWGRMNPPTLGHKHLISETIKKGKELGADPFVAISHSFNIKKNPLNQNQKAALIRQMFPNQSLGILYTSYPYPNEKGPTEMANKLKEMGYDEVYFIVGSDYDPTETKGYGYSWVKGVKPIIPGVPRGNLKTGISATKVRDAALRGNRITMSQMINNRININALMAAIVKGMTPKTARKPTARQSPSPIKSPNNNSTALKRTRSSPRKSNNSASPK